MYRKNAKPHHIKLYKRWGFDVAVYHPSGGGMLLKLSIPEGKPATCEQKALVVTR